MIKTLLMTYANNEDMNHQQPASAKQRGGCFSLFSSPIYLVLLCLAIFLMANGETTQPWELGENLPSEVETTRAASSNRLAQFYSPSVLYWEENILRWAADWELDPNLVATVMQIESCGDLNALSPAGAMGLFQVMPYHFLEGEHPFSPETNAYRGMSYLQLAMQTYSSVRLSFASYNGGISTAAKDEVYWPQETIDYVYWGTNIYHDASVGADSSATLDHWLRNGGANLCSQADLSLGLTP
jgi:hypothetical protein